jgi:hypothetical protein
MDAGIYLDHPEVIVLSQILKDPISTDLEDFRFSIVSSVNGTRIRTLQELNDALTQSSQEWEIRFLNTARPIILKRDEVEIAHPRILKSYKIRSASYLEGSIVPAAWLENPSPKPTAN